MPFSLSTRILGGVIVAGIALILLWPNDHVQRWGFSAFFVLPLLIWLLTSKVVRDAPPFDDTAFHKTRPPGDGYAFWRVVRFHLQMLAGISLTVLCYCWINNLGWPEFLYGNAFLIVPLIAVISVFGIAASLSTSRQHWAGWSYINLLLIPAGLFLWFCVSRSQHVEMQTLVIMPLLGAVLYPSIWWLVSVKRRRILGTILGMAVGCSLPWLSFAFGGTGDVVPLGKFPWVSPAISIRRLPDSERLDPEDSGQARASSYLRISNLKPDEFVRIGDTAIVDPTHPGGFHHDPMLWALAGACFATNDDGRLIPASTGFLRTLVWQTGSTPLLSVWSWEGRAGGQGHPLDEILGTPPTGYYGQGDEKQVLLPATKTRPWTIKGSVCRWMKVTEVAADKGGEVRLSGGGILRIGRVEKNEADFSLPVTINRSACTWSSNWRAEAFPFGPAIIATDPVGIARLLKLDSAGSQGRFLMSGRQFEFRPDTSDDAKRNEEFETLRSCRLHVYWPAYQGKFEATVPPPE